jgi:hypothetical protein
MKSCAADWQQSKKSSKQQSKKSSNSDIEAISDFPILPFALGGASGVAVGYCVKEYADDYVIPIPELPEGWNKISSLGMVVIGGISLIGSFLTKSNLRSGLAGFGVGGLGVGLYNGLSLSSQSARLRRTRVSQLRPRLVTPMSSINKSDGRIVKGSFGHRPSKSKQETETSLSDRVIVA